MELALGILKSAIAIGTGTEICPPPLGADRRISLGCGVRLAAIMTPWQRALARG